MEQQFILDLTLILLSTKLLGLLMKRIKVPEIVGALLAGILLGPSMLNWVKDSEALDIIAKIGVLLIMFSAGISTNIKQIKSTGKASLLITILGVILPLGLGYLVACIFNGFGRDKLISNMYYGVLLTATSVTITVATLKELGKLSSRVGTAVLSAAILDDIIGLIILTIFIGFKNPDVNSWKIILNTFLFFLFAFAVGIVSYFLFKFLERKYPSYRRLVILGLVLCFFYSYAAEKWFGLADITGAFFAGIVLSNIKSTNYIERRVDISTYMIFGPVFFASIGIKTALQSFELSMLWFGILFIIAGLFGKFAGCAIGAKICHFTNRESLMVGIGMMARAEVILITAQKGIEANLLPVKFMPFVIMLVIISSLLTPILLKVVYKSEPPEQRFDYLSV